MDRNGIQFGNLPTDHEIAFSVYQNPHNFRGLRFDPPTSSSLQENELHEDCDLSDAILGFISQVLMEEDMEDKSCTLYESLDLQAAEKSFYDVLGKKYPPSPSPSYDQGLFSVDHTPYHNDNNNDDDDDEYPNSQNDSDLHNVSQTFSNSDSAENSEIYDKNQMMIKFNKGFEEANKFLPTDKYNLYFNGTTGGSRVRKTYFEEEEEDNHQKSDSAENSEIYDDEYPNSQNDSDLHNVSQTTFSNSDSAENSEIYDKNQMMIKFNKGFEEANKFLPTDKYNLYFNGTTGGSRVRKTYFEEEEEDNHQKSNKQAAIFHDATLRSNEIDLMLLCSIGPGDVALRLMRNTLKTQTTHKDQSLTKAKGKTRAKKPKNKKQVIDLTTLLVTCAQAVATDDTRNASELLRQIRQHTSPFGDGNQRLAHCFANGLEARLAGTGSQIHRGLVSKKTSAADYIRAYYLYIASSPFRKISNFASNRTIMDIAKDASSIHVIDFGILYGFQWPTFIQRISQRKGGPPRVRLTGIEFPQPGFRPSETIEETGARLKEYANRFNVPFEYNAIAKRWENVTIEDLKIDKSEFLVVNCMYRSKNVLDETVGVQSARNVVLDLIRKLSPNIFVHGILNGSYNAPFFLTRFKEALFHFSALFDMLERNVPRERSERMLLEGEVFGREALNVIACEGWERIERPETYKQWHARNLRAGFVSVPFSRELIKLAKEKVGLYHKDFMIDEDNDWLLQGWKGRIIYAISCWKSA